MVFYSSFYDSLKNLPDKDFNKCIRMIFEYGLHGIEPDEGGIVQTIFMLIRPQIDKNNQRWMNSLRSKGEDEEKDGNDDKKEQSQKREATKKAAQVKQAQTKAAPNTDQTSAKAEPNVNVNDNVNANDNVNDNVNANDNVNDNENGSVNENTNDNAAAKEVQQSEAAEAVHLYGEYRNIKMTQKEHDTLKDELGFTRYKKCMEFFSRYLVRKPEHKSAKHFEDLRGWVLDAVKKDEPKDVGLKKDFYGSQWDFDLDDLMEKP